MGATFVTSRHGATRRADADAGTDADADADAGADADTGAEDDDDSFFFHERNTQLENLTSHFSAHRGDSTKRQYQPPTDCQLFLVQIQLQILLH